MNQAVILLNFEHYDFTVLFFILFTVIKFENKNRLHYYISGMVTFY
jgi:hypothetical protein